MPCCSASRDCRTSRSRFSLPTRWRDPWRSSHRASMCAPSMARPNIVVTTLTSSASVPVCAWRRTHPGPEVVAGGAADVRTKGRSGVRPLDSKRCLPLPGGRLFPGGHCVKDADWQRDCQLPGSWLRRNRASSARDAGYGMSTLRTLGMPARTVAELETRKGQPVHRRDE